MSWLTAAIYERFIQGSEEACLARWRADLLQDLSGEVLEIGAGTGLSLEHYPRTVTRLSLTEPDTHMRRRLEARCASASIPSEVSEASVQALPMSPGTYDGVVSFLVLCSVRDLSGALSEVYRVLRPGGRFVFMEHVAAENRPGRLKWQRRVEPFWKRVSGNCHLTRQTEHAITESGFEIERIERESIRKSNPLTRSSIRGVAVRPRES